ncbi:MAG: homoserine O-succinyltransferase [Gammaproteobacteria bacterium]|nr:homoserine O-succinyltransferase [Gammaproteobacteria bacterium]NIR97091.1 homoserine O-succinyltransferase [Gammaproteobacteria bacterium]NIT62794.1 homoserine O-succinyltransferase [Gammaproteobacteria bacterium]NIV19759.1 homoserine O-succinyltransferase [Gammaproteobacteria bacterium]NIX11203.1 homoserine O-succinyltransferase [Gammaproteobacteria bacterium]
MPLVANSDLPAFQRLRQEGETVIPGEVAVHQDIRELHIGLLNMMPDAALAATERQFFRLVGESNQIAQFYMHPFTLAELRRGREGRQYVQRFYEPFEAIKEQGLDALIITGANVTQPDLSQEPFWEPLIGVIDWAYENVTSTLCSCLATHAVMQFRYGQKRRRLPAKRWGVYSHHVVARRHPLVIGVNTRFDVPHSRFNDISGKQFEAANLKLLVESEEAGAHLAVSKDGFRLVFFQGHPEYDTISLLKEYKREVNRFARGELTEYPPFPENYFSLQTQAILEEHQDRVIATREAGRDMPELPEALVRSRLDNTWHDTAEALINNWIGKVYQITSNDRKVPFKEGVDPDDPLRLRG